MRVTINMPDPIYRRLKSAAALQGCSVKDLVLRGVQAELSGLQNKRKKRTVKLPIFESKTPCRLKLTNRKINEILFP